MKNHQTKKSKHVYYKFFTIIELLITISIIAILAAMLLPTLNVAREKAKSISCINNQKQIGQFVSLYQADWKGFFPSSLSNLFMAGLEPYTKIRGIDTYFHADKAKFYNCPADTFRMNLKYNYGYSYTPNLYCSWSNRFGVDYEWMRRSSTLKNPSSIMYLTDGRDIRAGFEGNWVMFEISQYPFRTYVTHEFGIDFRHPSKQANVLWADMHVKARALRSLWGTNGTFVFDYRN